MKKKLTSLLLALAFVLALVPFAGSAKAAPPDTFTVYADTLNDLGLFAGTDKGYELERVANRAEAAVMVVKLLGKDAVAKELNCEHPFLDVPAWADCYIGYIYQNGITSGFSETEYGSYSPATPAQYGAFMLRALGYDDNAGDFNWQESLQKMTELNMLTEAEALSYGSTYGVPRGVMVAISRATLLGNPKDSPYALFHKLYRQDLAFTEDDIKAAVKRDPLLAQKAALVGVPNPDTTTVLDAEGIYAKASPAVFSLDVDWYGWDDGEGSDYFEFNGSGFFISSDGIAVTNYHVIEDVYDAVVRTADQQVYEVESVLAMSAFLDIAVLKVKGDNFPYLNIADARTLRVAQKIYCIGSPLGYEGTITDGLVSSPVKAYSQIDGRELIQMSASIAPGSSGGVVLNEYGDVVGISTMGYEGANLNFAVPVTGLSQMELLNPPLTLRSIFDVTGWDWPLFMEYADEIEPNDEEPAQTLEGDIEYRGALSGADDVDLYAIDFEGPSEIEITLRVDEPYPDHVVMELIDIETGEAVIASRRAPDSPHRYIIDHLYADGNYTLKISSDHDSELDWANVSYRFICNVTPTVTDTSSIRFIEPIEPNDDFDSAQYLPFGSLLLGEIDYVYAENREDYFRFCLDDETRTSFGFSSMYGSYYGDEDLRLELYDANRELIMQLESNIEEMTTKTLKKGEYYIRVFCDDKDFDWDSYFLYVGPDLTIEG